MAFGISFILNWLIFVQFIVISPGRRTEDSPPRITEQPENLIVTRGSPATFNCKAEGRPEPEISWLKDGQPLIIVPGDARRTLISGSTLFFLQVIGSRRSGQDGGVYQCVARNTLGTVYSNNATLDISYLRDEFKREPQNVQWTSGDSGVLECNPPRGFPIPAVTWMKNDEVVVPDDVRVKLVDDGNLLLKELRKDDEGTYKCIARNFAGERISREAVLTVQAKPSFVNPPQDTITAPGEAAVLRCEVEGDPVPTISWSREIGDLPAGRTLQLTDNSLRIRHTSPEDDGVYICTAVNIWGTSDAQARLRVSAVPDFIRAPRDKTVHVNQIARFQCEAVGSPPPSIHWQKSGTEDNLLFPGQQNGRFLVSASGELQILAVTMDDAGTYICSATGGTGVAEASAVLRVLDESLAPPPVIQYGPSNQTLTVGSTATFLCRAAGNPAPSIQWTKDGTSVLFSNTKYTRQSDGSLQITNVQMDDTGMFTCFASNSSGETSWSASLLVIESAESPPISVKTAPSVGELPSAPSQPMRINVTQSSILIRWQAPSTISSRAPPVSGYQVEYFSPEQSTVWVITATSIQGDTHLITHLLPASSYMFIVRAVNTRGIGPPSPISEVITTADETTITPPTAECLTDILTSTTVEITTNTALSPTAIKVSWEALQNEDQIDGYNVRYRLSSGESGAKVQPVYGMTSTIITGLEPGMDYTFAVRPLVCNRAGQESPVVATRTLAKGVGPLCQGGDNRILQNKLDASDVNIVNTEDLGANAIQVRWEIARHVSAYIEGFHIKFWGLDPDPTEYSIETITGNSQVFVLKQLLPWKRYAINVRPFSGYYCGHESDKIETRTGPDIPRGPPQNVNARSNGTTFIMVTWRPPARDQVHGYIKGYHIACQGNSTSQERNRTIQGNTTFMGRVGGLTAGKVYRVQVAAFTSAGMGPTSSAVVVALPPARDPPPSSITPPIDDGLTMVTTKPWFYGTITGVIVFIILLAALVWRRRKMKHAANLTKNPLGLEGATHMTTLTSQYEGQPANGHPSWPPDQTWRSNNSSDCQSSHHESSPKDPSQTSQGEKGDMAISQNDQYHRNNVPVYAVVDNESEDDDESPSCPHMAHTLPLNQCNHLLPEHCQSLPQHITEPYASTTLVLPPNVREYMARRQNCSDTSSGSASGSIGYPNTSSNQQKSRKKAGKRSRQGEMDGGMHITGVPPLPPHRDTSHVCADCQSGISDSGTNSQGSRRIAKGRTGTGSKYPACNWTEFLPPPPEEPPMIGDPTHPSMLHNQDSVGRIKHPCNGHPNFSPQGGDHCGGHGHHAPAPPMRQHPSLPLTATAAHQHGNPHVQSNGLPHTLPVSRGDDPGMLGHPALGMQATTLPQRTVNGQFQMGVPSLAPHQVFADPRHEMLGRELLEFNDDLMSQSEVMSENEEVTPMLPRIGANTGLQDQSKLIPDDLETDVETSSNCTGSMLASWASMNGSSTGGSNRNSGTSCSSDGSFYADTDFASAVTAAAQNAGIPVVGSPPADLKVGRDLDIGGDQLGSGQNKQSRRTPNSRKGQRNAPQSMLPQHRGPADPYHQQQRILPAPPQHHSNDHQQDSVNKNKRSREPGCLPNRPHDNLFLRDTNDLGLTVTANPMAFAHEEDEVFNS